MKLAISYAVMVIPILVVVFGAGDGFGKAKLKYIGAALAISGICTAIGIKFFGLYAIGRRSVLEGDRALMGAAALVTVGVLLLSLHHLITFVRTRRRE
jgi:hypothetical protein